MIFPLLLPIADAISPKFPGSLTTIINILPTYSSRPTFLLSQESEIIFFFKYLLISLQSVVCIAIPLPLIEIPKKYMDYGYLKLK